MSIKWSNRTQISSYKCVPVLKRLNEEVRIVKTVTINLLTSKDSS
ncbi:hypothetical protein E2C01_060387 [Portunus trituberculatus]|uniref:Uncharacterized protein n=1 Tax=Portunus trituberculatus TaxID=210409 RepID=A0A5B7H8Q7_PORTR|nr:hypothetical protein [Portunus trituberculatus]